MENDKINLMLDVVEKIKTSLEKNTEQYTSMEKVSFKLNIYENLEQIFRILKEIEANETKDKLSSLIEESKGKVEQYLANLDSSLLEETKESIEFLYSSIDALKINLNTKEEEIKNYNSKLKIYNELLKDYKENLDLYKKGKITYEICLENYNICLENYKDLTGKYDSFADETLTKPEKPRKVVKKIEDLALTTLLEETQKYRNLLDVYEYDFYVDYIEATKKYDEGRISYEEYSIEALKYSKIYETVKNVHDDLLKQYDEVEKNFGQENTYVTATTEEEIQRFYTEQKQYEENIKLYNEYLSKLEELREKLEQNLISEEEYNKYHEMVTEIEQNLTLQQSKLKKDRKKIYNSSVLTRLKKQKQVLEEHMRFSNLPEEEKQNLNIKYRELEDQIKKIQQFKSTLVIKNFIKNVKKKTVTPKKKNNISFEQIDNPSEMFFYGNIESNQNTYLEVPYILRKIAGDYKYTKFDDFIYTHKDIKIWNFHGVVLNQLTEMLFLN